MFGFRRCGSPHFNIDRRNARSLHFESCGGGFGDIEHPISHVRAPVVDPDFHGAAILSIGHAHNGIKRELAACGGELVAVEGFAVGREFTLLLNAIPRGNAALDASPLLLPWSDS